MRYKVAALVVLMAASFISVAAQRRTITNADLEKYRQARLTAEREYRENFERLGMPSPEELRRRHEESRADTLELARQLRDEQIQREWINVQRESFARPERDRDSDRDERAIEHYNYGSGAGAFWSYGFGDPRHRRPFRGSRIQIGSGYVGGGQFWPTGPRTSPRPLIRIRRH